jgi:cell division septal protein FtsQ
VKVAGRMPRMSRRLFLAALAVVGGVVLTVAAPHVLRRLAFFRVRQIELVGIRHLAPDVVIAALGLGAQANVFDDLDRLTARVRAVHGVADARVVRRLPAAFKVIVREVEPVALVAGARGLTAVDADGKALPFEPERSALDVPVSADGDADVVGLLARIRAVDPALFQEIATARAASRGEAVLEFGRRRVVLARDAGPDVIESVALVVQDLAARGRSYAELDARYAGQIIVRRRISGGGA